MDTTDDTGRIEIARLADVRHSSPAERAEPATRADMAVLAAAVSRLTAEADRERGRRAVVGWIAGVAVSVALGMGGAALSLAQDAATDHIEVQRGREERAVLRESVQRVEREGRDRSEQIDRRLTAIESDVRWVRDGMQRLLDERRSDEPRRR